MASSRKKPKKRKRKKTGFFARCVRNVEAAGRARDPRAVCGALVKRKREEGKLPKGEQKKARKK